MNVTHIILRDKELQERLAEQATDEARTKTAVVIRALEQYLEQPRETKRRFLRRES